MSIPKELYVYIFVLADDLDSTKSLRSVSKMAYNASYDYFKSLLRGDIFIYHHHRWLISNKDLDMKEVRKDLCQSPFSHGRNTDTPNKSMIFKTNIRDLYNTFNKY